MGTCKYCGQKAGLFSSVHKECEEKHKQGVADFLSELNAFLKGNSTIQNVLSKIAALKQTNFLSQEDLSSICRQALSLYTSHISFPIQKQHIQLVETFLQNIPVSRRELNADGSLSGVAQRLYQGILVSHFSEKIDMSKVEKRLGIVERILPLSNSQKEEVGMKVLEKAAKNYLSDGLLTDMELKDIDEFANALALPIKSLPASYQGSSLEKIAQSVILKQIQQGNMPPSMPISLPIMLTSDETIIWAHHNINLYQEKIEKEWVGRRSGYSFRVMKGVYYHTGGSRGHSVKHSTMQMLGIGYLILTNKNIIFYSDTKTIKVPYKKIVGLTPYSDGIEIHRDGANAKRLSFQGFDCWFMMNLMSSINI